MEIYYNKYKTLSGFEVCKEIEKFFIEENMPLTKEQSRILYYYWGDNRGMYGNLDLPFKAYKWEKQKENKTKFVYRLSIPFYIIYVLLLLFIIRPLNWLFTGSWYLKTNSKLENFTRKWHFSIFNE